MKKLILALTIASATSLFAGYTQWFTATPQEPETVVNWQWAGEDGSIITNLTTSPYYWEIDAAVLTPATFTPTADPATFNTITKLEVSTTFDAAYDMTDYSEDPPADPPAAALGAVIVGTVTNASGVVQSTNYYAYTKTTASGASSWVKLSNVNAPVPADLASDSVAIVVELVYLNGVNQVRYSVKQGDVEYVLADANGTSLFYFSPTSRKTLTSVEFRGCGKVAQLKSEVRNTANFDGGTGEANNPYVISNEFSLAELRMKGIDENYANQFVKLDCSPTLIGWTAMGTDDYPFCMNFDGGNNTLHINGSGDGGFFGVIDGGTPAVTISNLKIDMYYTDLPDNAVAFAGTTVDNVTFTNCASIGENLEGSESAVGFVTHAETDTADVSARFIDCSVKSVSCEDGWAAAFVGSVVFSEIEASGELVTYYDGSEPFAAYHEADSDSTIPTAFKFYRDDEDDDDMCHYEVPDVGNSVEYPYYVVVENEDDIHLSQEGTMYMADEETGRKYTGTVYCGAGTSSELEGEYDGSVWAYTWGSGYTITYYVDGVEDTSLEPKEYDGSAAVNLPTPTATTDCTIFYWYTNSAFKGETFTTIAAGTKENKTFYAKNINGDGEAETPYEMSDEEDLTIIQGKIEDGTADDKCVKQTDDIALTAPFAGLGTSTYPFTGTYDGDGKALTVSSLAGTGFFNFVKGATIKGVELTVGGGEALALVGTATADAVADTAVTISACTNKTSAIASGAAFIATVAEGKAVSSGKLEANAKYTSIGSVTAEVASESDFNFATVSDSTASYVDDDEIVIGTNYKVMFANAVDITLKVSGTTVLNYSLADYNGTVAVESTDVNALTATTNTENKAITYVTAVKSAEDGVFEVEDSENQGNMKFSSDFINTVAGVAPSEENRKTIETALNKEGANGIPEWQNYALGLSTATELATADKKPIAAAKQTADSKIVFSLGGINPPSDSGAFITYKIKNASGEVTQYGDSITIDTLNMESKPTKLIQVEVIVNQANPTAK